MMPAPDGEQFTNLVHYGYEYDPPHTMDLARAKHYENLEYSDRRYSNDVVFMADHDNEAVFNSFVKHRDRGYAHQYRVPNSKLSTELFGDDDHPDESVQIAYKEKQQPELWEGVRAKREDAVTNNRVVRYRNAVEAPGSNAYIVPKSLIKSGDAEYLGTDPTDRGQIVVADLVDEDD